VGVIGRAALAFTLPLASVAVSALSAAIWALDPRLTHALDRSRDRMLPKPCPRVVGASCPIASRVVPTGRRGCTPSCAWVWASGSVPSGSRAADDATGRPERAYPTAPGRSAPGVQNARTLAIYMEREPGRRTAQRIGHSPLNARLTVGQQKSTRRRTRGAYPGAHRELTSKN
jgi:hypothetical protein